MLMAAPAAVCYWALVHSLVSLWRRLGIARTYAVISPILFLLFLGIFSNRRRLLTGDLGANQFLILVAGLLILTGVWLFILVKKRLSMTTFIGLPEIDPQGHPANLITEGIYMRMRHPRYAQVMLMIFACSLIVNYLTIYLLCIISILAFCFIAWLEERELMKRFGQEYAKYRSQIPMFVPRL